jgi:hypothetical protein
MPSPLRTAALTHGSTQDNHTEQGNSIRTATVRCKRLRGRAHATATAHCGYDTRQHAGQRYRAGHQHTDRNRAHAGATAHCGS